MAIFIRKRSHGGAHVPHRKHTAEMATVQMPPPATVVLPMSQHIGAPCKPVVKVGDPVKVGTLIGETTGYVAAPIHASVSGTVKAVGEILLSNGSRSMAVTIESDGKMEPDPAIAPPKIKTREEFFNAVRDSGLVGLGGAGFPTHVKLNAKNLGEIDTLIVNGAECEPYITSDYREAIESTLNIVHGMKYLKEMLDLKQVVIAIEANKPKAIQKFYEQLASYQDINVQTLPQSYPMGAEKVLIYEVTGRVVPEGKLPGDVGVLVMNIGSVGFLNRYLKTGMPLVQKRLTIDGGAVAEPKNIFVPIGTSIADVMAFCGGYRKPPRKFLMGGPMMGIAIPDENYPILKNNNAILALDEEEATLKQPTACIRCGRCVRGCPMKLMPLELDQAREAGDTDALARLKVGLCMECGTCSFNCPAKRPLVQSIRMGKAMLRAAQAAKKS